MNVDCKYDLLLPGSILISNVFFPIIKKPKENQMISALIAEATVCDFKEALEVKKPKSWLKSVSAFANTAGGTLFFGVDNSHNVVGLSDPQKDAEDISRLIKERISPTPRFILTAES